MVMLLRVRLMISKAEVLAFLVLFVKAVQCINKISLHWTASQSKSCLLRLTVSQLIPLDSSRAIMSVNDSSAALPFKVFV